MVVLMPRSLKCLALVASIALMALTAPIASTIDSLLPFSFPDTTLNLAGRSHIVFQLRLL